LYIREERAVLFVKWKKQQEARKAEIVTRRAEWEVQKQGWEVEKAAAKASKKKFSKKQPFRGLQWQQQMTRAVTMTTPTMMIDQITIMNKYWLNSD
jgi:hypothetical protein